VNSQQIANTIKEQVGSRALFMLGAKYGVSSTGRGGTELGGISFRIGRNAKGVTHVKISLDATDTYKVDFIKQKRAPSHEVVFLATVEDVYVDNLHAVIEDGTGLRTSLGAA